MAVLTTRAVALQRAAQGLGYASPIMLDGGATTTAAALASGSFTAQLLFNDVGTTIPTTLVGLPLPPAPSGPLRGACAFLAKAVICGFHLVRVYRIGTLNLAATGDQFTHDAAVTFPLTRTQYGQATQPLSLLPVLYVTTATTTTAPVIVLKTNAGGAGYTDQDGNSVVGTKSFTFPAAATAAASGYVLRVEDTDSGVRDIAAIEVTTAAAAGAATIFGVEILAPSAEVLSGLPSFQNLAFGVPAIPDLAPAAPTAGTLTSYLALMSVASANSSTTQGYLSAFLDT